MIIMDIHFYLDDEEETQITSFYDLDSNPFKIGDEIRLEVDELYPKEYNNFKTEYQTKLINDNKELETKFQRKKIKLIRESKYVNFKISSKGRLTIEYHCEYVDNI